ncbi:hypothetical protein SDRG_10991 [Saprolegnia diclina VS20]|uniref:Uncharacterized protein n=1 Tax=Saprolegnia diclina (strain VS20) TaxID=1156394 RepID=T0QCW5_SAPDV|nr:hypothetical protein SDRG_10991 [Saprolegnia diclina VS20]EQC31390.1 hypothetical protein SDRG_10991 [Saprolegnia diclina VS20]|eukprot:XP_008615231.1 hypothetical protein SDRG_10991 [Saprolegnia diclina VS20]
MAVTDDAKKARKRSADKTYAAANAERKRARDKMYYAANKEKILLKVKAYQAANKVQMRSRKKAYYAANKEALVAKSKAYKKMHRAQERVKAKEYRQKNKQVRQVQDKAWRMANRAYKNAYDRAVRARKKVIAAGKVPPPLPKLADFGAQRKASGRIGPAASTDAASELPEEEDDAPHPLAATTKKVGMVTFTNEHPFNMRKRGPEPCCDECAKFQPNALTSATNTVILAGTYQCTFCRDWTYYKLHRKYKRTRADARLDATNPAGARQNILHDATRVAVSRTMQERDGDVKVQVLARPLRELDAVPTCLP